VGGFAHFVHDGFTDCVYVLLPVWAVAFALTHAEVGTLKMVMSGTLAAMQVPAGLLAERYGERAILFVGTVLAGFGFVFLGWAAGFLSLAAFLLVTGAGCGTQHPLASSVVSRAYAAGGRRAALGMYNFTGDLGKVAAPFSVGMAAAFFGWPSSVVGYGLYSILAGFVVLALLPGRGPGSAAPVVDDRASTPEARGWGIANRRGYVTLAVIGMIDSAVRTGSLTFLPFLLVEKGASLETLGIAVPLVFTGGAMGKLVCGLVAERVGILRTVILTEVATGALIVAIIALPLEPALVVVPLFGKALPLGPAMALLPLFGVALNGTSSVLYGTIGDFVKGERQPRAYGLFYTLGIGTGSLSPVVFGAVSDLWGVTTALVAIALSVFVVLPMCQVLRPCLPATVGRDADSSPSLAPQSREEQTRE